jgi:phage host-nuclease inhibitor protein Gam
MDEIDRKIESLKILKMQKRVEVLAAETKLDDFVRKSYILETYNETINAAIEARKKRELEKLEKENIEKLKRIPDIDPNKV